MILIPILLCFFTGLLILWLFNQHKYLNVFEQVVLGFVAALSLFVLELFIQGIILNKLSLMFPIITFIVLLLVFVYKTFKNKQYLKEIINSIKFSFNEIKKQFLEQKRRKKIIIILILIYVIGKIFMVFSINTNIPTYDEDSVYGWDIKTKIFSTNKSLVLDKNSLEYFGIDYGRYPFAGIIDTYFLLPYGKFIDGLSNIISPLIYLLSFLLLFGIFFRKTNFFMAILSLYLFTSLPFVFIHGFGSYRNFPSGVFLFIFIFYLIDQFLNLELSDISNNSMILPLVLIGYISSFTRNEGAMLTGIILLFNIIIYHILRKGCTKKIKYQLYFFIPIILVYITNKIIFNTYPSGSVLNTGGTTINLELLNSFFSNINKAGVFQAPFKQVFYHPDYLILFLLFSFSIIIFLFLYKKMKNLILMFFSTLFLIFIFIFILYSNFQSLGLLTHFSFIRYPVSIILFLVYIILYSIYVYINKEDNNENILYKTN